MHICKLNLAAHMYNASIAKTTTCTGDVTLAANISLPIHVQESYLNLIHQNGHRSIQICHMYSFKGNTQRQKTFDKCSRMKLCLLRK